MTIEKKSLIANLKTTKKAIIVNKTTAEAQVSAKVLPRMHSRLRAKVAGGSIRSRLVAGKPW